MSLREAAHQSLSGSGTTGDHRRPPGTTGVHQGPESTREHGDHRDHGDRTEDQEPPGTGPVRRRYARRFTAGTEPLTRAVHHQSPGAPVAPGARGAPPEPRPARRAAQLGTADWLTRVPLQARGPCESSCRLLRGPSPDRSRGCCASRGHVLIIIIIIIH